MQKIIVVDDEDFVRFSLKSSIHWSSYGLELVGEADNGKNAVKLIEEMDPDIILLDIKMPVMDGIEVLKVLKQRKAPSKVIVLSSYNEFEYVREAMKLGAIDYLHKPNMNTESIISSILAVKATFKEEQEQKKEFIFLKQSYDKNIDQLKALFFEELILGSIATKAEITEKLEVLGIRLKKANIFCMTIGIDHYKEVQSRYSKDKLHILEYSLMNMIRELFKNDEEFELIKHKENVYLLIRSFSQIRSQREINSINDQAMKAIRNILKRFLDITVSIGASNIYNDIFQLADAVNDALTASKYRFFTSEGSIIYHKDIPFGRNPKNSISPFLEKFKDLIMQNDIENSIILLESHFNELKNSELEDEGRIRSHFMGMYYILSEGLQNLTKDNGSSFESIIPLETILAVERLQAAKELFLKGLGKLNEIAKEKDDLDVMNFKIKKAISYIKTNYNKDMTLQDISEHLDLNSNYLSRLFKEEMGTTITKYINKYRISIAAKLLKTCMLKNYEIAEAVGFRSFDHFSLIFKEVVGMTPNEFRNGSSEFHP